MKKATKNTEKAAIESITLDQIRRRKLTKAEREQLKRLAAMPDDKIDLSDIPEVTGPANWIKNPFYRPVTKPVTIRLNAPDIAMARSLSKTKGLPYQTYIKMVLHEALQKQYAEAVQSK